MNDKPTYKEYWTYRKYYFVKTEDGRYFAIENYKLCMVVFVILYTAASYLCLAAPRNLHIYGHVWLNTMFEGAILFLPLFILINKLIYRLIKFSEIGQDSDDFLEVDKLLGLVSIKTRQLINKISYIVIVLMCIFAFLNSVTAFYLRSLIDDRETTVQTEAYNHSDSMTVLPIGENTEQITIPKDASPIIIVTVTGTPEWAEIVLDGEPMSSGINKYPYLNWFWEKDYFVCTYKIYLDYPYIHDGSVLEMMCGDLHRKWVFDLPEE